MKAAIEREEIGAWEWLTEMIEAAIGLSDRMESDMGYGNCPLCGKSDHPEASRERRPNGNTTCGHCGRTSPSAKWESPEAPLTFTRAIVSVVVVICDESGRTIASGSDVRTISTRGDLLSKARSVIRDEAIAASCVVMDRIEEGD